MQPHRKVVRLTHTAKEITAYAAADGGTKATCTAHGLSNGDIIAVHGTTNYDGTGLVVEQVGANDFVFNKPFVADDGVGMWVQEMGSSDLSEDAEQYDEAIIYTDVTAYTSGSLIVGLETSPDKGTTWYPLASGASLNSISKQRLEIPAPIGKLVRPTDSLTEVATAVEMSFTIRLELARTGG